MGGKNFTWQVKWKFLHKSKLKVLKIAKGLKLNFTILTCAQGGKRERERLLFFLALLLGLPPSQYPTRTVKRVRLTFMRCCCFCFAGLYFYLLVGFSSVFSLFGFFSVSRSHSFSSFVVFALWANFWLLLVGFQICGKSEVRRKLNELAPAFEGSGEGAGGGCYETASHCPSAFPCCLSVCCLVYLFTCRLFFCFLPAFSSSHFFCMFSFSFSPPSISTFTIFFRQIWPFALWFSCC